MNISQTTAIRSIEKWLSVRGWQVIYRDLPNASRSGFGLQGKVALTFEHVLDRTPDIVAVRGCEVLITEVDRSFSEAARKFIEYKEKEDVIAKHLLLLLEEEDVNTCSGALQIVTCFAYFASNRYSKEESLLGSHPSPPNRLLYVRQTPSGPEVDEI